MAVSLAKFSAFILADFSASPPKKPSEETTVKAAKIWCVEACSEAFYGASAQATVSRWSEKSSR